METIEIPFGYIKSGKVFLKGWGGHSDREIGEVRDDDPEKSAAFFQDRYAELEKKVQEVIEKIETNENKGSFLMKLVHLKENLPNHDGLGDYQLLHDRIVKYENLVRDIIKKNRARNTEIKTALLEEAKQVAEIVNWKEATEKVNDLKNRWIKTGSAEEDKNETLNESFWDIVNRFFERKKQFYEDKQKLTEHRKTQYEQLVEEAKKLSEVHGKARFEAVKQLKEKWKEIGGIPAEHYKPLHEAFNKALKGRSFKPPKDYGDILTRLNDIKEGKEAYQKSILDDLKKELYRDKTRNKEKQACLDLIQLLNERDFVDKLAKKRNADFDKLDAEKKKSLRKGIIKDLITRDEQDLKIYEENSANFASPDGKTHKLVENKIKSQQKKIKIKSMLLEWVDSENF